MSSKRIIDSIPVDDGFVMPAEYEPQRGVWIIFAGDVSWRHAGFPVRQTQVELAKAIVAAGAECYVAVSHRLYLEAQNMFEGIEGVSIYEMTNAMPWPRDCGAITVKNRETGEVRAVDFGYNCWGNTRDQIIDIQADVLVARKMCQYLNIDRYKTPFILEGGSICVDGEGTLITTESCLLNENRNPSMSKEEIEETLREYLGVTKVIWIKVGIDCELGETDGHIDDVCHFIGPAEVVCSYTDDKEHSNYEVLQDAYKTLCEATDAKGRKLTVHKLIASDEMFMTKEEATESFVVQGQYGGEDDRVHFEGFPGVPSYCNFLITNGHIIFPIYGLEDDEKAIQQMEQIVGDRYKVIPVNAREIAWGGGSIHCFTQQVSK